MPHRSSRETAWAPHTDGELGAPSPNLTFFKNANIDLTEGFSSFFTDRREPEGIRGTTPGESPSQEKRFERGAGKPCQKLMEDPTTIFPLGGKHHAVVNQYRGVPYITIREYFDGQTIFVN